MKMHPMAALALSALMATCVVQAAEPLGVQAELTVWQVPTTAKGQAVAKAEQAKPGDVLSYQVRYQNTGTQVARKVVATLPIPATGLVFMSGTALPEGATASTDGRNFDALPLKRWVARRSARAATGTSSGIPRVALGFRRIATWARAQGERPHARR
jgi:uncharacterized repeat protein (TIGR01451 family)